MNNRSTGSVSFNTIKRSHRQERLQRRRQGRIVLLAIFAVLLLLALTGMVFLILHIAHTAGQKAPVPDDPSLNSTNTITYQPSTYLYADTQKGNLILVNRKHQYEFPAVRLENLEPSAQALYNLNTYQQRNPNAYKVAFTSALLQPHAAEALNQMLVDYYTTTGDTSVWAFVAYRTYAEQANKDFPQGFSDHHTGLLISLTVDQTGKKYISETTHSWIFANCHKYGFVQRFPAGKAGLTEDNQNYLEAFRYVGVAHATYMKNNNLCMEEYIPMLKDHHSSLNGTDGQHLLIDTDGNGAADYEVYYVPANTTPGIVTTVYLPSNYQYTISGDNCGGFIVTVNLNAPIATAS